VPQAHPNRACREDDIALAGVPSGERVCVLAGKALARPLHGDALGNGLGGEVRLPSEQLFAVVGDGAPVNLERSLHAEDRLSGALLGEFRLFLGERFANLGAQLGIGELGHDGRTVELEDGRVRELGAVGKGSSARVLRTLAMFVLDLLGPQAHARLGDDVVLSGNTVSASRQVASCGSPDQYSPSSCRDTRPWSMYAPV
jgi:hypothetical protein